MAMFVYQGTRMPLPASISADILNNETTTPLRFLDCRNDSENRSYSTPHHIKDCQICDRCILEFIISRKTTVNGKENYIVLPDDNHPLIERWSKALSIINGHDYISNEDAVLSILWNTIKECEQKLLLLGVEPSLHNTHWKRTATGIDGDTTNNDDDDVVSASNEINTTISTSAGVRYKRVNKNGIVTDGQKVKKPSSTYKKQTANKKVEPTNEQVSLPAKQSEQSQQSTAEKETSKVSTSVLTKISCFGKIKDQEWGCRKSFPDMTQLKTHWSQVDGKPCLQNFLQLRMQESNQANHSNKTGSGAV